MKQCAHPNLYFSLQFYSIHIYDVLDDSWLDILHFNYLFLFNNCKVYLNSDFYSILLSNIYYYCNYDCLLLLDLDPTNAEKLLTLKFEFLYFCGVIFLFWNLLLKDGERELCVLEVIFS
jgi:hypothetical protein